MPEFDPSEEMAAVSRMLTARDDALVEEDALVRRLEREKLTSAQKKDVNTMIADVRARLTASDDSVRDALARFEQAANLNKKVVK
jgi:hypothetical protein